MESLSIYIISYFFISIFFVARDFDSPLRNHININAFTFIFALLFRPIAEIYIALKYKDVQKFFSTILFFFITVLIMNLLNSFWGIFIDNKIITIILSSISAIFAPAILAFMFSSTITTVITLTSAIILFVLYYK